MSVELNKQAASRLYELLNVGQVEMIGDLIAPYYEEHDPLPGQGSGRDGVLDRFSMITRALAPQYTPLKTWWLKAIESSSAGPTLARTSPSSPGCRDREDLHHERHRHLPGGERSTLRALARNRPTLDARTARTPAAAACGLTKRFAEPYDPRPVGSLRRTAVHLGGSRVRPT